MPHLEKNKAQLQANRKSPFLPMPKPTLKTKSRLQPDKYQSHKCSEQIFCIVRSLVELSQQRHFSSSFYVRYLYVLVLVLLGQSPGIESQASRGLQAISNSESASTDD